MAVEIPAVPEGRTTDNVYLAGGIDDCSLCDVTPGERYYMYKYYFGIYRMCASVLMDGWVGGIYLRTVRCHAP